MPTQPAAAQDLIPRPAHYAAAEGRFRFTAGTGIACDQLPDSLRAEALRFVALVGHTCDLPLSTTTDTAAAIVCRTASAGTTSHDDPACRPEGYRLDVTPRRITVTASTAAGFFYAFQTLTRLMPPHVAAGRHNPQAPASVPACHIADAPRFAYRGFMLDVSRHFFGVDEVKRMLDVMAAYKMNRFHWHLTNDQGWRLEIKKYPRLTTVGAERQGSWDVDPTYGLYFDYDRYGPAYYTQEQVRDIVAYARERHIEIIPEIEFPGHCAAAMTAYPEFSCDPHGPHRLWSDGDIASRDGDLLNVASPAALRFVKDILDEVADLFPYPYIHIGGDECPTHGWERNDACRALMDSLGLTHPRALQSRFTHELARHMATQPDPSRRRRLIAWNETLTAPGTDVGLVRGDSLTIMCWVRSGQAVNAAESLGLPTIVTPQPTYYINRRQSPMEGEVFNAGRGTDCTLQTVYEHRPAVGRTLWAFKARSGPPTCRATTCSNTKPCRASSPWPKPPGRPTVSVFSPTSCGASVSTQRASSSAAMPLRATSSTPRSVRRASCPVAARPVPKRAKPTASSAPAPVGAGRASPTTGAPPLAIRPRMKRPTFGASASAPIRTATRKSP